MQHYYMTLLGEQVSQRRQIDPQVITMGNVLTIEQQLALCVPFTEQDIKTAIFSIPNTKVTWP